MELDEMIDGMTAEVYQRLVTAVETGKWADGVALTPEQKSTACSWCYSGRREITITRSI